MNKGDEDGLLWQTTVEIGRSSSKKRVILNTGVPIDLSYSPPSEFRSIVGIPRIGLDVESYDPKLETMGCGAFRDAFLVGVAIAYSEQDAVYYPMRHNSGYNVDNDQFMGWLREEAPKYAGEIVGANLAYDLEMLAAAGVFFTAAAFRDVQYAEPLLDENRMSYKLENIAQTYLGEGKYTSELERLYGDGYIKNMHKVHACHVAKYAETDTVLPLKILAMQEKKLHEQDLYDLFKMESDLTPLLLQMRIEGVGIDLEQAERAYAATQRKAKDLHDKIKHMTGVDVQVWANDSVAKAFDAMGVQYPRTATNKPSFKKKWLEAHPSEVARLIMEQRGQEKIGGTFLKGYIMDGHRNGRIHCNFHPLRGEDGGAVSGRFSSSGPNLQNIPVRDEELGPILRGIFIPNKGMRWGTRDYSQIEYRLLVHFAVMLKPLPPSAAQAMAMYKTDPKTDFHEAAAKLTGKKRKEAKNINFGVVYGMGDETMAANLGTDIDTARKVLSEFHAAMPFLRSINEFCQARANQRGFIKTILKRRRRFDMWELRLPEWSHMRTKADLRKDPEFEHLSRMSFEEVSKKGYAKRFGVHAALNALLQGSAADLMKKAMVDANKAGIFKVLPPHLTIHDELNVSVPDSAEATEAWRELEHVMEGAMQLNVPVLSEGGLGNNWSHAKEKDQ